MLLFYSWSSKKTWDDKDDLLGINLKIIKQVAEGIKNTSLINLLYVLLIRRRNSYGFKKYSGFKK